MSTRSRISLLAHLPTALLAVLALVASAACGAAGAEEGAAVASSPGETRGATGQGAVLLELFTSQGCSSCPPADRLLSELADDPELAGRVFPLAFHVDYWNYIGWTDPFSSARWSQRQRRYAGELPAGRVYTPQLVVDGSSHLVGSRRGEVRERVRRALRRPPAGRLTVTVGEAAGGRVPVTVAARLDRLPEGGGPVVAWVALWQDGLVTPVGRGENADKVLRDDRVVRHLEGALELPAEVGATVRARVDLPVEAAWPTSDLGVVAFLQSAGDLRVHGAAGAAVPGG